MIRLQQQNRRLKDEYERRKFMNDDGMNAEAVKPHHMQKADEKIDELTRAAVVLAKSKEKDGRLLKMQKKIFDKSMREQNMKIKKLEE